MSRPSLSNRVSPNEEDELQCFNDDLALAYQQLQKSNSIQHQLSNAAKQTPARPVSSLSQASAITQNQSNLKIPHSARQHRAEQQKANLFVQRQKPGSSRQQPFIAGSVQNSRQGNYSDINYQESGASPHRHIERQNYQGKSVSFNTDELESRNQQPIHPTVTDLLQRHHSLIQTLATRLNHIEHARRLSDEKHMDLVDMCALFQQFIDTQGNELQSQNTKISFTLEQVQNWQSFLREAQQEKVYRERELKIVQTQLNDLNHGKAKSEREISLIQATVNDLTHKMMTNQNQQDSFAQSDKLDERIQKLQTEMRNQVIDLRTEVTVELKHKLQSKINKLQSKVDVWVGEMEAKIQHLGAKSSQIEPTLIDISSQTLPEVSLGQTLKSGSFDILGNTSHSQVKSTVERSDERKDQNLGQKQMFDFTRPNSSQEWTPLSTARCLRNQQRANNDLPSNDLSLTVSEVYKEENQDQINNVITFGSQLAIDKQEKSSSDSGVISFDEDRGKQDDKGCGINYLDMTLKNLNQTSVYSKTLVTQKKSTERKEEKKIKITDKIVPLRRTSTQVIFEAHKPEPLPIDPNTVRNIQRNQISTQIRGLLGASEKDAIIQNVQKGVVASAQKRSISHSRKNSQNSQQKSCASLFNEPKINKTRESSPTEYVKTMHKYHRKRSSVGNLIPANSHLLSSTVSIKAKMVNKDRVFH